MIFEEAGIDILDGREAEFEQVMANHKNVFEAADGCHGFDLLRGVEHPSSYRLMVRWDSVDDHTRFRETPEFLGWRDQVASLFAGAPKVEHFSPV